MSPTPEEARNRRNQRDRLLAWLVIGGMLVLALALLVLAFFLAIWAF